MIMKLKLPMLAVAVTISLVLAGPAWANDNQNGEKQGSGRGGREASPVHGSGDSVHGSGSAHSATLSSPAGVTRTPAGGFHRQPQGVYSGHSYTGGGNRGVTTVSPGVSTQRVQSNFYGSGGRAVYGQKYNPSNNYGGRWFPGNTHRNWNRNQQYYWNNHHYCWFNGGWLIIDGGFWPYGYPYPYWYNTGRVVAPYYATDNSTVAVVQNSLAALGYYVGPSDGIFGPMTSEAIRRYQIDAGMPVTGVISPSLLNALGLD